MENNNAYLIEKIINYLQYLENNLSPEEKKKNSSLILDKIKYDNLDKLQKEYLTLLTDSTNKEEKLFLEKEIKKISEEKEELISLIKEKMITEEGNTQNVLIEIRPGTGGDEAGLFVNDLYQMYHNFAIRKNWEVKIIKKEVGSIGNINFISFLIKGDSAFNFLRNESGVHRVQRVPKTGKKDKKHTSTASVVILPEAKEDFIKINKNDLKIDTYKAGGAGGQHVNKTDSAVRITHLATGIVSTSQDGRSQHDNKEKALLVLKSRILERIQSEKKAKLGSLRSSMIGNAERSENFRTYNFYDNRVTDKRLKIKLELSSFMNGEMEEVCEKSIDYEVEKIINALHQ